VLKLPEEDEKLRSLAAVALGRIGSVRALPVFDQVLRFTDGFLSQVRRSTVEALSKIDDLGVIPLLVLALMDEDSVIHTRVSNTLKGIGSPAVGPLIKALQDEELEAYDSKRLLETLVKITERNFGDDVELWETWWEGHQKPS